MKIKIYKGFSAVLGVISALSVQSCVDNDFKELDSDVIALGNYDTGSQYFDVSIENKEMKGIQSSRLSAYQLGQYTQNPFGKTNASILAQVSLPSSNLFFGTKKQDEETKENYNEEEKVVSVTLNIPFFSTLTKVKTENTNNIYKLDSLYGNEKATFDIKVTQSNYFLKDIDESLTKEKIYFSDFKVDNANRGDVLANETGIKVSAEEIVQNKFDNPITQEDESKTEEKRFSPQLSISLDNNFFQTHILDKEGKPELSDATAFYNYFRGIIIETDNFSDDLMMLLDFSKANIEMVYEYKQKADNKDYTQKSRVRFPLSGIRVNMLSYENSTISNSSKNVYLQGGKRFAELEILSDADISKMKNEDWLINDAELSFEVDASQNIKDLPSRLYIYDAETGLPLVDYRLDVTDPNNDVLGVNSKLIHLGKYDRKTNAYKIRLTNHITNIVRRGQKNIKLALVVAQNIKQVKNNDSVIDYIAPIAYLKQDNSEGKTSLTTATTPLSVVLYGGDVSVSEAQRVRLKITYSKPILSSQL